MKADVVYKIGDWVEIVGGVGDEAVDQHIGEHYQITRFVANGAWAVVSFLFEGELREIAMIAEEIKPHTFKLSLAESEEINSIIQRINSL